MNSRELEQSINELEVELDRIRALYEQYFLGLEKLEPLIPLRNFERKLHKLRKERINNTALRFRFQQIIQRYNTLQTYWRRVARQIEEGTYRPDVMRARARAERRRAEVRARIQAERQRQREGEDEDDAATTHEVNPDELDEDDTDPNMSLPDFAKGAAAPQAAPRAPATSGAQWGTNGGADLIIDSPPPKPERTQAPPPPRRPPPPPRPKPAGAAPASAASPGDDRFERVFNAYVSARQRCNQSTAGLSFEKMSSQLSKQAVSLRQKTGMDVDFVVKVRDGKAVIRAVRRRDG